MSRIKEFCSFIIFGALNTISTILLYQALLYIISPYASYTITFIAGILLSSLIYSKFVFSTRITPKRVAAYVVFYGVSYLVGIGLLGLLVTQLNVSARFGIFGVIIIMTPFNFLGARIALRLGSVSDLRSK